MIITIRRQATSEERTHLMTQVCRVIPGSLSLLTTTITDERKVIVLDGACLDRPARVMLHRKEVLHATL